MNNFVYNKVECHEQNLFIPFSNNQNGATTYSGIKFKLVDTYESSVTFDGKIRRPLFYQGFGLKHFINLQRVRLKSDNRYCLIIFHRLNRPMEKSKFPENT